MKKKIIIILILTFIIIGILFAFREKIAIQIYKYKYSKIECINKDLIYDKKNNSISENLVKIDDFNVVLSNVNYTDENELNFELKFSNSNSLNNVGYLLRVYNEEYFLGDRFNGQISLSSNDWIMYQNIFYKNIFPNTKDPVAEKNLLNSTEFSCQSEILENGEFLHRITYKLPEEFIIKDKFNINLFDINYQNSGDKNFYKVKEPLLEINYAVTNIDS